MKQANDLHVLAFAPHPDDVELSCGATLARLAGAGYRVGVIDLTAGELSSNGSPEIRAAETARATAVLGLQVRENLKLPDGRISADGSAIHDGAPQISAVVSAIRRHRPRIVLLPYWLERHPDHQATSALVERAAFFAGVEKFDANRGESPHRPLQFIYYQMRYEFKPTFIVDTSEVHDKKIEAINCYASQFSGRGEAAVTSTLINDPALTEIITARARTCGAMIGVRYGEPFLIKNALSLNDPVAHFTNHPGNKAHIFPGVL